MKNNKNSKSILYKEIENKYKSNNKVTKLITFWKVKTANNAEELYNNFCIFLYEYEFYMKLSKLSSIEADILELLYNFNGVTTRAQIISSLQKKYELDELRNGVMELISKFLIYERKTLNNLTNKSFKYIIYDEVYDSLKKINLISFSKELLPELPTRFHNFLMVKDKLSYDIKLHIYSKKGFITFQDIEKAEDIKYIFKLKENLLKSCLLKFDKIIPVFIYNNSEINNDINEMNEEVFHYSSFNYKWIIYLQEIFLYIKKSKLSYTQKGILKKNDYETLIKICENNKDMFEFLFQIMLNIDLIREVDNKILINTKFRKFLSESVENKIRKIINHTGFFDEIIIYLKNLKSDEFFSVYDVIKQYFNDNINENSLLNPLLKEKKFRKQLERLYMLGLLDKVDNTQPTSYAFTNAINKLLLRQINKLYSLSLDRESEKDGILINRDFSIFIYPDKMSDYHKLIISTFTEKVSHSEVITRRITKKSVQDAIYMGYQLDEFINIISNYSKIPPDNQIIVYCQEWEKSLKKVKLKKVYLLESESDIIDTIELDPEIDIGEIQKIGENHIIINNPEKIPYKIGLDNIYVYKEEEDF